MEVTTVAGSPGVSGHADGLGNAARFDCPWGVVCDKRGNAFFSDRRNHRICKRAPDGTITTFAGGGSAGFSDGQGAAAKFNQPCGLACDADDNLLVADCGNNRIRRITPGGLVTTVAGRSGAYGHKDGPAARAKFNFPWDVAVRPSGSILVADTFNHCIRVIYADPGTAIASVYTLAGQPEEDGFADGNSGAARFDCPAAIASDSEGNAYVADSENHCIRTVSLTGAVASVAGSGAKGDADGVGDQASFNDPRGLALDGDGNLVVVDCGNHRIRMISPDRAVTTLAGSTQGHHDGQGTAAKFDQPQAITFDASGDLLVADNGGHTIRKVAAGLTPPARLTPATPVAAAVPQFTANLAKLLDQDDDDNFYDVVFLVQGETIRAHKNILSAQCEYFATMFSWGFTEGSGTVETPLPVADTTPVSACQLPSSPPRMLHLLRARTVALQPCTEGVAKRV